MTVWLLTSIVSCDTKCEENKDVVAVRVPAHYGYSNTGSYRFLPTSTKIITKSITTNCKDVVFPLHNLTIENCNNCTTKLVVLSLANRTSPVLPKRAIPEDTSYNTLILNDLNISKISPEAFGRQNLFKLELSGNKLTEIELGVFNSLTKLQNIDMSFNNLKSLRPNCFMGLPYLETLNVSNNELNEFSFDIFDVSVTQIELLDLSFNKISNLNRDNKIPVEKLYLSNNQIKTIKFCPLNFTEINLSHNFLEFLDEDSCDGDTNQNKLKVFNVSFNKISKCKQFYFENASNLEYLYLNHNNISDIATGVFFNLKNLIFLNLSENHLQTFQHGTFDSLQNLKVLDLSSNNLKSIKTALHALINLKELYLQNNFITSIDSNQILYKDLQKISFYNNNFTCDNLVQVFFYVRSYTIVTNGKDRNTSNIHGIACSDNQNFESSQHENFKMIKNDLENIISSVLKIKENKSLENKEYVNNDLKEKEYKYLKNLMDQYNGKLEKLANFQNVTGSTNTIIIILVCIACIISISNFLIYKVLKNKSKRIQDEVELLQE